MKILAADIRADRAELALLRVAINGDRKALYSHKYTSSDFTEPRRLIEQFLHDADAKSLLIERFCLSVAAPVENNHSMINSLNWELDAKKIGQQFYINDVSLISDFDSAARGIDAASQQGLVTLNEGMSHDSGIRVVTGAGHGLGLAWMDHRQDAFNKNDSEGGMVNFAPIDKEQIDLLEYLMNRFNHVSYERILSTEGLQELYRYCQRKYAPHHSALESSENNLSVKQIIAASTKDPAAEQAIKLFVTTYGAYVGNLALLYQPMGGIYIGGQVATELQDWMQSEHFLNVCLKKGRMSKLVKQTPIYLVTAPDINLQGAIETATYH
ncbi:MAG: glucokinase [Leucothrix sp.]